MEEVIASILKNKNPDEASVIFLLHYYEKFKDDKIKEFIKKNLRHSLWAHVLAFKLFNEYKDETFKLIQNSKDGVGLVLASRYLKTDTLKKAKEIYSQNKSLLLLTYLHEEAYDKEDELKSLLPVSNEKHGCLRAKLILEQDFKELKYETDAVSNLAALWSRYFHVIHSPHKIDWLNLPINGVQLKGSMLQDCYQQRCMMFSNEKELFAFVKK